MNIGQRATRPRQVIIDALASFDGFVSARDIHTSIQTQGNAVSLASVYRTLRALSVARGADAILRPDGETVYRKCSHTHHHHLLCRECGMAIEITETPMGTWADTLASAHQFDDVTHCFEVFGRCANCRDRVRP